MSVVYSFYTSQIPSVQSIVNEFYIVDFDTKLY